KVVIEIKVHCLAELFISFEAFDNFLVWLTIFTDGDRLFAPPYGPLFLRLSDRVSRHNRLADLRMGYLAGLVLCRTVTDRQPRHTDNANYSQYNRCYPLGHRVIAFGLFHKALNAVK